MASCHDYESHDRSRVGWCEALGPFIQNCRVYTQHCGKNATLSRLATAMLFSSPSGGPSTGLGMDVGAQTENISKYLNSSEELSTITSPKSTRVMEPSYHDSGLNGVGPSIDETNSHVSHENVGKYPPVSPRFQPNTFKSGVVAGCSCRNIRKGEDRIVVSREDNFCGIFDGHNGSIVSDTAAENMSNFTREEILKEQKMPSPDYREAIRKSF